MKMLRAAVAAMGLVCLPTMATADPASKRETVAIRVSAEGLDLKTRAGVAALRGRTAKAIAVACSPGDRPKTSYSPDWQCRNELGDAAAAQLDLIARR